MKYFIYILLAFFTITNSALGQQRLEVDGDTELNGDVTRSAITGTIDLLPIAFGHIDIDGNVVQSTPNLSSSFSGANTGNSATSYIYSVANEILTDSTHIAFVTPFMPVSTASNYTRMFGIIYEGGSVKIRFYNSGAPSSAYNIIIYKY